MPNNYVYGGALASTRYDVGTPAYFEALSHDLSSRQLTQAQYDWALKNPGMAIPVTAGTTETSAWTSFWGGISNTADILFSGWAKYQTMENQREMLQLDVERRRLQLEAGVPFPAPAGFGGINVWTLAAIAGIALMAMLLLKKP